MNVLVLEDDELVADLLESVVAASYPGALVQKSENLADALARANDSQFDLVITDWNLPDGSGLDLVRVIRSHNADLPIMMVSGRSDRDSVLKAAHFGISGYITKPFSVELVHSRLAELMSKSDLESAPEPELETLLEKALDNVIQLPGELDPAEVLELMARAEELSPAQLAERWREHPGLIARLMDVANGSSFRRSGKPIETVKDAIALLGMGMTLNQALALSMDVSRAMSSPELKTLADSHTEIAVKVGREAQRIAMTMKKSSIPFQKAGLLSRIGELAVLRVLNQFVGRGGQLDSGLAERCLKNWAQPYGNRLKIQWRMPLGLRDMIGAVHFLPRDSTREDRLIMRAAALIAQGHQQTEECQRLMRRLGLEPGNHKEHE